MVVWPGKQIRQQGLAVSSLDGGYGQGRRSGDWIELRWDSGGLDLAGGWFLAGSGWFLAGRRRVAVTGGGGTPPGVKAGRREEDRRRVVSGEDKVTWLDLAGSGWIWMDLAGSGWEKKSRRRWRGRDSVGREGWPEGRREKKSRRRGKTKSRGWIWLDLAGRRRVAVAGGGGTPPGEKAGRREEERRRDEVTNDRGFRRRWRGRDDERWLGLGEKSRRDCGSYGRKRRLSIWARRRTLSLAGTGAGSNEQLPGAGGEQPSRELRACGERVWGRTSGRLPARAAMLR